MKRRVLILFFCCLASLAAADSSRAWFDETHIAVAQSAGYRKCYDAAAPDIAKARLRSAAMKDARVKDIEEDNHFFDNLDNREVTPAMVLKQVEKYNVAGDKEGHLYGAIVATLEEYQRAEGYREELMAYAAHYIGDLSQPFHNAAADKAAHVANDGVVEAEVLGNIDRIKDRMYEIKLQDRDFKAGLAQEIARIANSSRALAARIKQRKNPVMTKEEAYTQLGHSASLLRAVLNVLDRENVGPCPVCGKRMP